MLAGELLKLWLLVDNWDSPLKVSVFHHALAHPLADYFILQVQLQEEELLLDKV